MLPQWLTVGGAAQSTSTSEQKSSRRGHNTHALAGGARIETWGYKHAGVNGTSTDDGPCVLCSRDDVACTTLACRLQRVMVWQLRQMQRGVDKYGLFLVTDPHHTGAPQTDRGLSSASSMWDQVRMGWKATYINMLVAASLEAWLDLEEAGLVDGIDGVNISDVLVQLKADIVVQLGRYSDVSSAKNPSGAVGRMPRGMPHASDTGLGFTAWVACNAAGTAIKGGRVGCDPSSPDGDGQEAVDIAMVADQALAVRHQVGAVAHTRRQLVRLLAQTRVPDTGLVRNNAVGIEHFSPRYVTGADTWHYVDDAGFAQPWANNTGGHFVCRPPVDYCWGNFGYTQQNGGFVLSTASLVLLAGPYAEALADFRNVVSGMRSVVQQLVTRNYSVPLASGDPQLLRRPLTDDVIRAMCVTTHHGNASVSKIHDPWGKDLCNYYKTITYGLRTGPRNYLTAFGLGMLGVKVSARGTLRLFGTPVAMATTSPPSIATVSTVTVRCPPDLLGQWPAALAGLRLEGLNVREAPDGQVTVDCNNTDPTAANWTLTCAVEW
eukprot:m.1430120 g.1430120  ORF g.1430120 m.1430120 type:complete len:548 (-) comp25071_c0_seq5:4106-5749(-)